MRIHTLLIRFVLAVVLVGGLAIGAQAADSPWVATWTTAISPPGGFGPPVQFENVTLRQIVHTSIGGSALRVQVSNTFGEKELTLGGGAIAVQADGASITSGTG